MHLNFILALDKQKLFSNTETNKGHYVPGNSTSESVQVLQHFSE